MSDRTRDVSSRDQGGRDRPARDSDRDGPRTDRDRGGSNRSRSPRRDRGGRRSDNRYRSRSPIGRDDRNRDSGRGGRGGRDDRSRNDNFRGREPPKGPRGGGGRSADYRLGVPVKVSVPVKEEVKEVEEVKDVNMEDQSERPEGMDDETWAMQLCMGFTGFKSTKETKVPGNDKNWGIRKEKELKARQYMNRQGGFNRPLSPSRDA
jgi:U4/U6.U5 tri-snRNP-associated protein 3